MPHAVHAHSTAEHEARHSDKGENRLKLAARLGYASRGLIYLVIGGLALAAAFTATDVEGARGAIETLFEHPVGWVLVYVLIAGLACYSGWRFWQALRDTDRHGTSLKGLGIRFGLFCSGALHVTLAFFAARLAFFSGGTGERGGSGFLPDWFVIEPWMLWVAALVPIVVGAAHIWKAITAKFEKHFLCEESVMRWVRPVSRTGLIARGLVFFLIAFLLGWSRRDYSPDDPPTTEDALSYLGGLEVGGVLVGPYALGTIGAGLLAFALYSFAQALYRRVHLG